MSRGKPKKKLAGDLRRDLFQSVQANLLMILERINRYVVDVAREGEPLLQTDAVASPGLIIDIGDEELEVDFINDITFLSEKIMSNLNYSIGNRIKESNAKEIMKHFQIIKRNLKPAPSLQQLQRIVSELSQIESMISEATGNSYIV